MNDGQGQGWTKWTRWTRMEWMMGFSYYYRPKSSFLGKIFLEKISKSLTRNSFKVPLIPVFFLRLIRPI